MRVLLDTHVLLWALSSPRKLPARVAAVLVDPNNDVFVSSASTWEIVIKVALGKLKADPAEIAHEAQGVGFTELPLQIRHTVRLLDLPMHHRDPFDRMLVAQALEEGLTLVTSDGAFSRYPVTTLWN